MNGAAQPALIVNDLKRGATSGQIGLWIGAGTEAYFRNLESPPTEPASISFARKGRRW